MENVLSRKAKIIATIGPATMNQNVIADMLKEGVNAFRINFSHSSHEQASQIVDLIRSAEKIANSRVPVIADLQGPTVRLGDFNDIEVNRENDYVISENEGIIVNEDDFFNLVEVGDTIIIDGGRFWAKVKEKDGRKLKVRFMTEGVIGSRKTIAIQGKEYPLKAPTEKDISDLQFAVKAGIEGVAISFIKNKEDVLKVKEIAESSGGSVFTISKIETISGVNNIKDIVQVSDYILVARGDLGSHFPLVKIPEIQRHLIEVALDHGKPSIVATQLLDSMTVNPIPTRAEVTDVYTAVTMGADSLMVSGETAVGKHPVDVIRWLNDIAFEAERNQNLRVKGKSLDIYDKFAEGVVMMSELIDAKLVAITTTGKTPMRLARFRPKSEILAACESEFVFKKLQLTYGVMPVLLNSIKNDQQVVQELKALKFLKAGEKIIVTRSLKQGVTDAIKILEVQ